MIFLKSAFIAFMLCSNAVAAQHTHGTAIYHVTYQSKNQLPQYTTGELVFDDHKAVFTYAKNSYETELRKDTVNERGEKNIMMSRGRVTDATGYVVYTDFNKRSQISRYFIRMKPFVIFDTIVPPVWTLTGEKKQIGKLNCQAATTLYYGREYIAWFTTEVPVSYGPWKLHGLPGLIVEAASTDKVLKFELTNLNIPGKNEQMNIPANGEKIQGYAAFRALEDKKLEETKKYGEAVMTEMNAGAARPRVGMVGVNVMRFEKSPN